MFVDGNFKSDYGGQRRMLILASALSASFHVTVVTTGEGVLAERARSASLPVHVLQASQAINQFGGQISGLGAAGTVRVAVDVSTWTLRFARWCARRGVDAVVANDVRSCLLSGLGARLVGVPVVWSVRDDTRTSRFHSIAMRLADRVVTVSDGTQGVFTEPERARLGHRLQTIYNGLPFPEHAALDRSQLRSRLRLPADGSEPLLAIVGMITPRKGHVDAIRALAHLRNTHGLAAHLAVIGDTPDGYAWYEAEARRLTDELGLTESVRWLGYRDDAVELMSGADMVILPSRNEGLPGVLIEALGVETPVVTYDCSGAREIVRDGSTGSIVPVGDHIALADSVAYWIDRPRERSAAGANGALDVRARFSVARYVDAYGALLAELVGGRRRWPARTR